MTESETVLEFIALGELRGEARGEARFLLRHLELRFGVALPGDLSARIRETTDPDQLATWFDAAHAATSIEDFRRSVGL